MKESMAWHGRFVALLLLHYTQGILDGCHYYCLDFIFYFLGEMILLFGKAVVWE
jgi:hypothetical protein